jgi:prolyl 4-hydroxylase
MGKKTSSSLSCKYVRYHPLLVIAPVKEELVYDNPPIRIYHDIITEKQIETLKALSLPKVRHLTNQKNYIR